MDGVRNLASTTRVTAVMLALLVNQLGSYSAAPFGS